MDAHRVSACVAVAVSAVGRPSVCTEPREEQSPVRNRGMADVITGDFGTSREALAGLERVFGDAAGLRVGLRRIEAPHGDELQVTVGAQALSVPRPVAVVLANAAGEDEADRIGKAVLEALQLSEGLRRGTL